MLNTWRPRSHCRDKMRYSPKVILLCSIYAATSEVANREHPEDIITRSAFLISHGIFGHYYLRTFNDSIIVGCGMMTRASSDSNAVFKSSSRVFLSPSKAQKRRVDNNNTSSLEIMLMGWNSSLMSLRTRTQLLREYSRSQFTTFSEMLV